MKSNLPGKLTPLLLVTFLFIEFSCEKETYMVPESFKRYFYFPVGSWWVYKNQSGKLDTLTIQSISSEIADNFHSYKTNYEQIIIRYNSSRFGDFFIFTSATINFDGFSLCSASPAYFTELTDFAKTPKGEQKAQNCSTEIEWWIEDTVIINNKNYYNVVVNKTTSTIPSFIEDYPIKGYFKEDIGLIKRELQNGEIWELVDYKINK